MNRRHLATLGAAAVGMAVVILVAALAPRPVTAADPSQVEMKMYAQLLDAPQPDTSSPRWKTLTDDVGIMTSVDERLGLRGRLYVKINGMWRSVAVDGPADAVNLVPAK